MDMVEECQRSILWPAEASLHSELPMLTQSWLIDMGDNCVRHETLVPAAGEALNFKA